MPTLRCSICAENWPVDPEFNVCPRCLEPTSRVGNVRAMDDGEAYDLKAHLDFERFYEDWDAKKPSERLEPTPDEDRFAVA